MPIKKIKQFTAWSYSRLTEWEQCPFKAMKKHLEKVQEPDRGALARGRAIEESVYGYIFRKTPTLPEGGARFPDELAALRKIHRHVMSQRDIAFNRRWEPVDWFSPDAWVRIRMDLLWEETSGKGKRIVVKARVVDLKTGKIYEDKLDQLDLYNLTALLLDEDAMPGRPDISVADMWYLDQGEIRTRQLVRSEVKKAKAYWEKRVAPMLADTVFTPHPGMYCKWCHLSKSKRGPCPF